MNKDKPKRPKTEIKQSDILKHADEILNVNSYNPTNVEDVPNNKQRPTKKINESDPLITKIERFITDRYELRLDEVRNVLEVRRVGDDSEFKKDERFEANLTVQLLREGFKGVKNIVGALLSSDFIQSYHPIRQYLTDLKPWDGQDRIKEFTECLTTFQNHKEALSDHFKKHLIRCIASAFIPGFFNKHCFVIIGTGQSMGKTSFIRYLVPKELQPYQTDAVLEWKDKDANIALGSNWIINLDELANLNRDETNSLKATLSRNNIKIRRPYDRVESEIPRLANFFGSTNDLQFLTDLTGNVRWVCFRIFNIDFKYSEIDINQIWAQAYHCFKNKFEYQLTRDELTENEKRNAAFMLSNPEVEAIQKHLVPGIKGITVSELGEPKFATSSELMKLINGKGNTFRSDKKFGQALQACGFDRVSERIAIKQYAIYGYWYFELDAEIESDNKN